MTEATDPAAIRVTVGQKRGVLAVLARAAEFTTPDSLAEAIAVGVLCAEDDKSKHVVITRAPAGRLWAFGPYASAGVAFKALHSGALADRADTFGAVVPLSPVPRSTAPKPKPPTTARKARPQS